MTVAVRSAANYRGQMQALLPTGAAWPRDDDAVLTRLLDGLAEEFARLDGRVADLVREADPDTALELLADWEQLLGLPDSCTPAASTTRERQRAAARKISSRGGQSRAYFTALAALMGYSIEIDEFRPFRCGMRINQALNGESWAHAWRVRLLSPVDDYAEAALAVQSTVFRMGARMGERLRSFSSEALECIIRRAAPAQSAVLFAYEVDHDPTLWFNFSPLGA